MYRFIMALALSVAFGAPASAWATEYTGPGLSADLVMVDGRVGSGRISGRYYFDRGGQRYELAGKTKQKMLIFNRFSANMILVGRNDKVRVDENRGAAHAARFGDEPCGGYAKALFLGSESRFGRTTQVWRCERPQQVLIDGGFRPRERVTVWFDTGLKHFIRIESNTGAWIELSNIREGRQPPALFDAPSRFSQFSVSAQVADVDSGD